MLRYGHSCCATRAGGLGSDRCNVQYSVLLKQDGQTQKEKLKQAIQSRNYEAFSPVTWMYGSLSTAVGILLLFYFVVQNFLLPE
jgi:hypothetical protein